MRYITFSLAFFPERSGMFDHYQAGGDRWWWTTEGDRVGYDLLVTSTRTLHRVITVAGFVADLDFADDPSTPPDWSGISLPPYTRSISVWAVPLNGPDPDDDDQVPAGTTTLDLELVYGDDAGFTRALAMEEIAPNSRVVCEDLPVQGDVWVRCTALNTVDAGVSHIAIFWEKMVA